MNLHLLRMFLAVVEHQGFSRAAVSLSVSQSAVSKGVRELEHQLSLQLIERGPGVRGVRLTESGQSLHQHARGIFALERNAIEEMQGRVQLRRGSLRIGASTTVASYWLPPAMAEFMRQHPDVQIQLAVGNTDEMASALIDGRVDVAFVEGEATRPGLKHRIWRHERMQLVVARDDASAMPRRLTLAQLAEQTWLMREPGSGTRQVSQTFLAERGIVPARVAEFGSNEAIVRAVVCGAGIAILPMLMVQDLIDGGRIRCIGVGKEAELSRPLFLMELATRSRSPALEAFLSLKAVR